ncbi:MAG: hypothetical protein ACHBN1_16025 [Heteroscytonema crispum UTEX LB 1556]
MNNIPYSISLAIAALKYYNEEDSSTTKRDRFILLTIATANSFN